MKDIKTLYLDAKARGTPSAVKAYSEAVQELLESNPLGYYSQAEYIISSSIGLKTFPEFVEKWGLPIPAYDHVMELLEGAVAKAEEQKKDAAPYQEAINYLEAFRAKYSHCFAMYETAAYIPNNPFTGCVENVIDEYIEKYYSSDHNSKHVQGRMLPSMASNLAYGEMAIPDLMITAGALGPDALKSVFEYFKTSDAFFRSPERSQFIYECSKDVNTDQVSEYVESLKADGIETRVESAIQRNSQLFREAAIVGEDNAKQVYTEQDLENIQKLITMKEAIIAEGGQDTVAVYNDVMRLYESLDGFIDENGNVIAEDVADSVIPNLPMATNEAAPWMANTMNKKTGAMPIYISRNHDLGYGEEPTSGAKRPVDDNGDTDPTLDDFRRKDTPSDDDDDTIDPEDDPPKDADAPASSAEPSGNNYYYYTYNNSLNQNRNSFNKDNSTHDDHSRKQDDHSSGKHINSNNITGDDDEEEGEFQALESAEDFSDFNKAKKDLDEKEKAKEVLKEMFQFQGKLGEGIELGTSWAGRPTMDDMRRISSTLCESHGVNSSEKKDMFSLDVHRVYNPFMELGVDDTFLEEFILMCEGAKQDWRQECRMFQQMFNHDLNKLGDIKSPPKKITLNLDGKKMCFHTSKGYSQTTGRQMERYAQIPTSIHNFNVNRDDFVEDRIGIAKGVIHRLRMIDANCPKNITIADAVKQYNLAPARFIFKPCGEIGITFTSNIKGKSIGLNIEPDLTVHDGDEEVAMESAQLIMEGDTNKTVEEDGNKGGTSKSTASSAEKPSDSIITKLSKEEFDELTKKKHHGPVHYIKKVAKKTAGKFKEGAEENIGFVVMYTEDVAAADMKPESDHPIRDRLMDFDRETTKVQQAAKKKVQEVQQGAKAFAKPVQRSMQWVGKMVHEWRDMDENKLKEKIADPHARNNLFSAIGSAIKYGSLAKAGLLLNPVFLFLSITKGINHNRNITRLRNEIMGELDAEIEIINEKIHQADQDKKPHEKYKLMRFRKELEKKKLRVGGGKKISRVL